MNEHIDPTYIDGLDSNIDGSEFGFRYTGGQWEKVEDDTKYILYDGIMMNDAGTEVITYCKYMTGIMENIIIRDTPRNVVQYLRAEQRGEKINNIENE